MTRQFVVSTMPAMLTAFSRAERVTFSGSMMPLALHVAEVVAGGVVALAGGQGLDLLDDDGAVLAGVDRDAAQRLFEGAAQDLAHRCARRLPAFLQRCPARQGVDQGHATAGHDALFDGGAGGAEGVLNAVLALLAARPRWRRRP